MDVDESFAAYVAARWSTLLRLATLLVGPEDADEVTQAALVRAHLSWTDVQESASPDDQVRHLLVETALSRRDDGAPGSDRSVPARAGLWEDVAALPAAQRAVLVLRHLEGLSDAEVADALGCRAAEVAAEARALETGVDVADLRDVLARRSDEVRVPLPPVPSLLARAREARRARRRRAWGWAAGVAAALVGALTVASLVQGSAGTSPSRRPAAAQPARFLAMLPTGRPPRVAYAVGRSLHLGGGRELVLGGTASAIVQTRKWLYVAYLSGAIVRIDLVREKVATVAPTSHGELVTDRSGEHVAWLAAGRGRAVVVLRTVSDWSVLLSDEQAFPARPRCCDNPFLVDGITDGGQVVTSLPAAGRSWVWSTPDAGTDTHVREISGLGHGAISQVTGGGLVVRYPSHAYAVGTLDHGVFHRITVVTAVTADFGDPLGHRVVYADDAGEVHVRERVTPGRSRRPSQDVRLLLPALADGFAGVRWEDDEHVLLDVSDFSVPGGALVRCTVDTGACEVAVRFDGPHVVAD